MKRRTVPLFRIGLFVAIGFFVFLVFVFFIGSEDKLFAPTKKIHARFKTVSGLKNGAQVQIAGMNIGSVTAIKLPQHSLDSVTVTMKIEDAAMPLIRRNSNIIITTEGLIGDKLIVIEPGDPEVAAILPDETLPGKPSKDFGMLGDTLAVAVRTVSELTRETTELIKSMRSGQGALGKLLTDERLYTDLDNLALEAQGSMRAARESIERVSNSMNGATNELNGLITRVNNGEGSLGRFLKDEALYNDVATATDNMRLSSYDLRDAIAKISLGSGRFAELTEALKHNFLFKGYFEDRGYWDAAKFEVSIDQKIDTLRRLQQAIGKPNP